VKLCKARHAVPFVPLGTNDEQGLGRDRVCEAQRSNESPIGAFKWQRGLRQQMEGLCPDKRLPQQALAPTRMTEWTAIFQALKICGHRSILAFALSVQH